MKQFYLKDLHPTMAGRLGPSPHQLLFISRRVCVQLTESHCRSLQPKAIIAGVRGHTTQRLTARGHVPMDWGVQQGAHSGWNGTTKYNVNTSVHVYQHYRVTTRFSNVCETGGNLHTENSHTAERLSTNHNSFY